MAIPKLHTLEEAREALRVGRTTLHSLIKTGQLKTLKIGGRRFVDERDLVAFVDAQRDPGEAA